jgi:tRNA-Thr(GGU) m(6)t(6)A37 methyltransferase TsaA
MELIAIGTVESPLVDRTQAPKQGNEGAPDAWLVFEERLTDGLDGLGVGDELFVLTWLDRSRRDTLRTRPRNDPNQPELGVFCTRSPERPNPIWLHRVRVIAISGRRFQVRNLEALNETPIIDIKPVIDADERPV